MQDSKTVVVVPVALLLAANESLISEPTNVVEVALFGLMRAAFAIAAH